MTALYLLHDEVADGFMPFALTRPASELRVGAMLARQRWERALGMPAAGLIVAPHLGDFEEPNAPPVISGTIPAGSVLASARCAVALAGVSADADVWSCDGQVAAVRIDRAMPADAIDRTPTALEGLQGGGARASSVTGRWISAIWDLVTTLPAQLAEDIAQLGPSLSCQPPDRAGVIGSHSVFLEDGAVVEPYVVLDASAGPILVRAGATIRSFSRLVGPCVIDGGSTILGDRVSGCSIGSGCMIRGEISDSIVIGNANKAHDGFVGHSVLGRWVNLGAGTTTSNLKNTYGSVSLATPTGLRDTGQIKLGSFFGDHVKTGIGLRLTTGTVIGAGSSIHGAAMPPKNVPPFSWGEGTALGGYELDKFLRTAERAMGRRGVQLGERAKRQLASAHALGRGAP